MDNTNVEFWHDVQRPSYTESSIVVDYNEINKDDGIIDMLDIYELINTFNKYSKLSQDYIYSTSSRIDLDMGVFGIPRRTPYNIILEKINSKIESFYPKYNEKIIFTSDDCVNGYQLYNCNDNIFSLPDFLFLKEMYENNKSMTFEEFEQKFNSNACSDWSKMDEHGVCFGGFWKSDDKNIRDNAYSLSREHNCKKLYELPYSNKLKLWSVDFGCRNRLESVRYSNFLCHNLELKIIQMDEYMKQIDKQRQISKIENIIKNISMEPSRIVDWYFDEEEKQKISNVFDISKKEKKTLIEIIKEQETYA